MATELRRTGISVVGDLPWGTHFCYFYETRQDLIDVLIPYFKTGLENTEFCLWVISDSELLTVEEATSALRNALPDLDRYVAERSIEVVGHEDWFLSGNTFDLYRVADRFKKKLNEALARGYAGMRVNGSPAWLSKAGPKELRKFEAELDKLFPHERTIASCSYPLATIGADAIFDVVRTHQFAIARRQGEWEVVETPELIQAKAEIKRLNEVLEQRVIERTRELAAANEELTKEIAERKRIEEQVRSAEGQSRKMLDTISQQIWGGPSDGTLDYCNYQWRAYAGLELEEIQGDGWQKMLHPDDKERVLKAWYESVATGKPYEQEERHRRADGVYRWFLCRGVPMMDAEGRIERWFGSNTDITELKEAEDALRRSEDRLRLVIDTVPALIHTGLPDGQLDFFNQRWLDFVGLSLEDVSGWKWTAAIHPEDVAAMVERWRAALATGEPYEHEARVRRADGEYRWMVHREAPLRDERGNIVKWYASSIDIEDRKRAEDALRQSEDRLRLIIDTIPTMAWTVRPDGIVDFLNQRWMDYTGLSLEQYVVDPTGPIHPEDVSRIIERWLVEMAVGEAYEEEMRLRSADGEYRWFLVRTAPLRDEQGNLIKWYGVSIDIEDHKRAEERLRATTEQLRALSASLQSARDEESIRIGRELHDELGAALSSLRWDLEEVVEVMSGSTDQSQFAELHKRIEAMIELTDTTVNAVRRIASELRPAALDELGLSAAIEWQARQFQERTGIMVECDCTLENVDLSREQSTAAFRISQEALTNILRHAQATEVHIQIKEEDGEFILTISDNGRGITNEEKLGQRTLGLVGMRERAHLVGGKIDIAGSDGKGTVLTLRFPIVRAGHSLEGGK